jgi:hypothetical protein
MQFQCAKCAARFQSSANRWFESLRDPIDGKLCPDCRNREQKELELLLEKEKIKLQFQYESTKLDAERKKHQEDLAEQTEIAKIEARANKDLQVKEEFDKIKLIEQKEFAMKQLSMYETALESAVKNGDSEMINNILEAIKLCQIASKDR